jgi:CRP-like cAMP-binding protein
MAIERAEIVEFLKKVYLFLDMPDEVLNWIAAQFHPITLERNTIVYSQGAPSDCFYLVFRGRLRATRYAYHNERLLSILMPGDFFGEEAILFNHPRRSTITTIGTVILLRMERDQFALMLSSYPPIKLNLQATAESRRLASSLHFSWLGQSETIYFLARKHDVFLYRALLPSIIAGVLAFPFLAVGLAQGDGSLLSTLIVMFSVMILTAAVLWGVWSFVDWGNDYYIVTSQRVIWLEKVVGLYDSRREAPLDTILAVNVNSSQLGRFFDYGNVTVRTFTGGIQMRNVNHPYLFALFVEGFKKRAIQLTKEEEDTIRSQALEQAMIRRHFPEVQELPPVPLEPPPIRRKEDQPKRRESLRQKIDRFFKVRYEQDGVITYRKHWYLLFRRGWIPILISLFLAMVSGFFAWATATDRFPATSLVYIALPIFLLFFADFLWIVYVYLDWSNDIYRLTPEQILDIERKPLGQESKKSAPLESILSIEHERENLLGIVLNFGPVIINIGETKFIFHGVYNPDLVHQDIADYREALLRKKHEKEIEQKRQDMVDWLITYHDEAERMDQYQNEAE